MYSTGKEVKLLDRRLGILHLSIYSMIMVYVFGVRIWFERSHEAMELAEGLISVHLEGGTYASGLNGAMPVDGAGLAQPYADANALFIPTRTVITRGQQMDNCTDPAQSCAIDADCVRRPPLAYGLCEGGHCVQLGWCPREQASNPAVSELVTLQEIERMSVVLIASITFPRLSGEQFSTEDGRTALTRWSVVEIVR